MAAEHTCISQKRFSLLVKQIFQEEFKKQGRNILNMNETKNFKQEIGELKTSLDFTEDVLEKNVEKLEESIKKVDARGREIYEYQVNPNYVLDKLAELEGRSRRNKVRIDRINREKRKTCEMCETKIKNIFSGEIRNSRRHHHRTYS